VSKIQKPTNTLNDGDFQCWGCSTTVTGRAPRLDPSGVFEVSSEFAPDRTFLKGSYFSEALQFVVDEQMNTGESTTEAQNEISKPKSKHDVAAWLRALFDKADELRGLVASRIPTKKLALPSEGPSPRTNLEVTPVRYSTLEYKRDTSFYWRYVYDGSQDLTKPEAPCEKKPGQKYWAVTYADGKSRNKIARLHTRPSCLLHGFDEVRIWGPDDLDEEYRERNKELLANKHGVGLWMWKHYVEYRTMGEMNDGDIMFYIDSDFRCDPSIMQFMCLAQENEVAGFHHSHQDYTLARLASRDSMILMDLDHLDVSSSVQSSGGNILFRKTPESINFVREMAAWSQQPDVIGNRGRPSKYGEDYDAYLADNYNHQCDQAISSLLLVKYKVKTYPWLLEGRGAGSDDEVNRAQRRECGLDERAMTVHVKDNMQVSWIGPSPPRDLEQIKCMESIQDVDRDYKQCL